MTAQRLAVLRAISERPHSTAAELDPAVRSEIGAISLQAVYDTLAVLTDRGMVRRIRSGGRRPATRTESATTITT